MFVKNRTLNFLIYIIFLLTLEHKPRCVHLKLKDKENSKIGR